MSRKRTRREFLRGSAAVASASLLPMPAIAQATPRFVVVGGGFGGTSVARTLKATNPKPDVTLVELSPTFTACPFSNAVIGGLRDLKAQQFGYYKVRGSGVNVVIGTASGVDASGGPSGSVTGRYHTTAWCCRLASTSGGMPCPATTRLRPQKCHMPGAPVSRPRCCAANSSQRRMVGWW